MFAVKGWSVDAASLQPQTEIFKPSKAENGESKKSKKRKRGTNEAKQDPNIRADDVGRLWEQHIEGKGPSKSQKQRERKKQKLEHAGEDGTAITEPQSKKGKSEEKKAIEHRDETTRSSSTEKKMKKHKKKSREEKIATDGQNGVEKHKGGQPSGSHQDGEHKEPPSKAREIRLTGKLTLMQSAMRQKLISARFRHLNQALYTEPSVKAQELFDQNPDMFEDYHAGFRQQVSVWPENPLDKFIQEIRRRGKIKPAWKDKKQKAVTANKTPIQDATSAALPRTHGTCIIADLGCGDARLAKTLTDSKDITQMNLKLHSYDLHSPSVFVTKADISNLPLQDGSVDIAIFCLALMGTNWISFIEEAYRILHWKGELWVAEIKSRFGRVSKAGKPVEHSVGNKRKQAAMIKAKEAKKREEDEVNEQEVLQTVVDGVQTQKEETDVSAFVEVLKRRGFMLKPPTEKSIDLSNKMFVKMEFIKALTPTKGKCVPEDDKRGTGKSKPKFIPGMDDEIATEDESSVLKPCLYKIR